MTFETLTSFPPQILRYGPKHVIGPGLQKPETLTKSNNAHLWYNNQSTGEDKLFGSLD